MKTCMSFGKLMFLVTLLLIGLTIVSCEKDKSSNDFPDPATLPKGLTGTWVEVNTMADTIIFNSNDDSGLLWFQRGYEIRNGYRLPVIGSTGYHYKISPDSINLVNMLSSYFDSKTYPFQFDESQMTIRVGKFSEYINTPKFILTFRKIK